MQATFLPAFCRVVAMREHGDAAVGVFDTNPSGEPYLYEVHYHRGKGGWEESSSGNGSGRHLLDRRSDLGVVTLWDQAPPDTDRVRAEFGGKSFEEPTADEIYMFAWWNVPYSTAEITAFRIKGEWVRAPTMSERLEATRRQAERG